jgi:alpha-tubulin suppressor-like RCC1 family protein
VSCWGKNRNGQLGDGTGEHRHTPTQTSSLGDNRTAVAISGGGSHTCAILDDGSVSCWGKNYYGQIGDGTGDDRFTPTQTTSLGVNRTAVAISAGYSHTCAILDDGSVSCWGWSHGLLGDATNTPTQTSSLGDNRTAVAISAGGSHTCAILDDGSVSCWGANDDGQLGDGTTSDRDAPTQTSSLGVNRTAVAISAGGSHTCAILDDGSVICWGKNNYGQIGDGTNGSDDHRLTPTQTSSLGVNRTAVAMSAGGSHTCVILDDGSMSCWGLNFKGQLGDGSTNPSEDRNTPTQTANLGGIAVVIAAGGDHTCAILEDDLAHCWGYNFYGQLGDGTTTDRHSP